MVLPRGRLDSFLRRDLLGAPADRRSAMKQAVLGTGLILAPLAWFASLEGNFALARLACSGHGKGGLLLVSAVSLSLALIGGLMAWTQRDSHRRLAVSGAA